MSRLTVYEQCFVASLLLGHDLSDKRPHLFDPVVCAYKIVEAAEYCLSSVCTHFVPAAFFRGTFGASITDVAFCFAELKSELASKENEESLGEQDNTISTLLLTTDTSLPDIKPSKGAMRPFLLSFLFICGEQLAKVHLLFFLLKTAQYLPLFVGFNSLHFAKQSPRL